MPDNPPVSRASSFSRRLAGRLDGGVRHDQRVDAPTKRRRDHGVERLERDVGGDLEEHRTARVAGFVARVDAAGKEVIEEGLALQVAQSRRVRRGHIDRHEVDKARQPFDAAHVVGDAVARVLVGADIHPDDAGTPAPGGKTPQCRFETVAVEPEPVDDRLVALQTEETRSRIARLRKRDDAAEFDKAEAERQELVWNLALLVEACRKTDGVRKPSPEELDRKPAVVGPRRTGRHERERADGEVVRRFGIEGAKHRRREWEKGSDHVSRSGKICVASCPRGNGLTHRTAAIASGP